MKQEEETKYQFPMQLGQYTLIDLIGIGGMGEVFLAKDPICQRTVALKRILPCHFDKSYHYERFLLEPKIAAQLAHPSIIPIYSLYIEPRDLYYTMPYIEGESLLQILIKTRYARNHGLQPHIVGDSVYALMLMFLNICQAIYLAHSRGFLHRDIKPGNIMVRNLTQVVILDWGCATSIEKMEEYEKHIVTHKTPPKNRLTRPMSPLGTLNYMAPERAIEKPASVQTDIYSLGATLYHMLTLEELFDRPDDITEWRKQLKEKGIEPIPDPQTIAPEREITPQLSRIVFKCLDAPSRRYTSVKEIIEDLTSYIQGQPEWTLSGKFHVDRLSDWEFQENILLAKHMAISRFAGMMEWVMLMLSKEAYLGNIQLKAHVKLKQGCCGVGFAVCIPEKSKRLSLESGYLIWIGSKEHPGCTFLRSNVEMLNNDTIYLEIEKEYAITVLRQDNKFCLYIDEKLIMTYTSHIPVVGGHFGFFFRDANFDISPISLYIGSQNVQVKCLSVPDAFFMIKDYPKALSEYRRIARSFKGRAEGREAIFRSGITLIEIGKNDKKQAKESFSLALEEFEKLHKTAGSPLEYLGKSLVYQAEKNLDEEIKCLELAIRMHPKNPLTHVIKEHIIFRLYETAQKDRIGAYAFALLTIRQLPSIYERKEAQNFIKNLTLSWETIPFIKIPANFPKENLKELHLSIQLAFYLARPNSLYEIAQDIPKNHKDYLYLLENVLLSLIALGYPKLTSFILKALFQNVNDPEFLVLKNRVEILIDDLPLGDKLDDLLPKTPIRFLLLLIKQNLTIKNAPKLLPYFEKAKFPKALRIWAFLLSGKTQEAKKLLETEKTKDSSSLFYMLQGCLLGCTKGEKAALAHFEDLIETSYPKTPSLLGHFLNGNISLNSSWMKQAFLWEKLELYRQLALYYYCLDHPRKAKEYEKMIEKELSKSQIPLNFI